MGGIALTLGIAAAIWLVYSQIRGGARGGLIARLVVWFAMSAVAFAAKLWPVAFMLLVGAGAVILIERMKTARFGPAGPEQGREPRAAAGRMTADDARAVLGVEDEADEDAIRAAHRRLIAKIHPDGGGSDYLAAQVNEARSVLLDKIRIKD